MTLTGTNWTILSSSKTAFGMKMLSKFDAELLLQLGHINDTNKKVTSTIIVTTMK